MLLKPECKSISSKTACLFNFKSSTSLALAQPNALLIIEYPHTFDLHNLRKFERIKINIPVTFFSEEGGRKLEDFGILRDISSGVALISHTKEATKRKLLHVSVELPTGGSIKLQKAGVQNLRKNPKSEVSPYVTGVKWKDLLPETEEGISRFITERSKERRENSR